MSADIATFASCDEDIKGHDMNLHAFVGGVNGNCIQFTIGSNYCCLSEAQLEALAVLCDLRITGRISATGGDLDFTIGAGGTLN